MWGGARSQNLPRLRELQGRGFYASRWEGNSSKQFQITSELAVAQQMILFSWQPASQGFKKFMNFHPQKNKKITKNKQRRPVTSFFETAVILLAFRASSVCLYKRIFL